MITSASIDDQELAVAAELAPIDDPAVARRHDLAAVARLQDEASRQAAILGLLAESEDASALGRQRQQALGIGERYGRLDAARRQHRHAFAAGRKHYGGAAFFGGRTRGFGLARLGGARLRPGCCDLLLVGAKTGLLRHLLVKPRNELAQ